MSTIDFASSSRKSFLKGFMKGLTAPLALYRRTCIDTAPRAYKVMRVTAPKYNIREALAGDWRCIGMDLEKVIKAHGETTQDSKKFSS